MELTSKIRLVQSSWKLPKKLLQRELEGNHEDFVKAQMADLQGQN